MLVSEERANRSTGRKSLGAEYQQTQPTYDTESRNRTRATLVGGECSHHCAHDLKTLSVGPAGVELTTSRVTARGSTN